MTLKYSNILVAVDGSKESELAFKKGAAAAVRNNATLHLAHIIDNRSFGSIEAYDRTIADRTMKNSEELLSKYKQEAEAAAARISYLASRISLSVTTAAAAASSAVVRHSSSCPSASTSPSFITPCVQRDSHTTSAASATRRRGRRCPAWTPSERTSSSAAP